VTKRLDRITRELCKLNSRQQHIALVPLSHNPQVSFTDKKVFLSFLTTNTQRKASKIKLASEYECFSIVLESILFTFLSRFARNNLVSFVLCREIHLNEQENDSRVMQFNLKGTSFFLLSDIKTSESD
jgi:hypothetical protein